MGKTLQQVFHHSNKGDPPNDEDVEATLGKDPTKLYLKTTRLQEWIEFKYYDVVGAN